MEKMTVSRYYTSRLEKHTRLAKGAQSRLKGLALLRLAIFLATLVMIYFATGWSIFAVVLVAVAGIVAFLSTVMSYIHLQRMIQYYESLATISHDELEALKGNWDIFADGAEYEQPGHHYAADLDFFGKQSLFQYLNRSATTIGQQRLAHWLANPLNSGNEIIRRQGAVRELSQKADWRQEFMASGYITREGEGDKDDLLAWVTKPAQFAGSRYLILVVFMIMLTFTVLGLAISGAIAPAWLILYLAVPTGVYSIFFIRINKAYRQLTRKSELVKKYSGLLKLLERETFSSEMMNTLAGKLPGLHGLPSEATRHLSAILDAFEQRNNMLMGFVLNFLFLWDIIQVMRTERWQARHREELPQWLEVLAETDALCSLANFHFNHPASIFPSISIHGEILIARDLGHPLIPARERVDNPADITGWRHFTIITGANMAGKSTYLRTVGVNFVLAMAGSAVIAKEMTFTPACLITSIRTRDSLQKNESYFYAELKRLKLIMDRLTEGEKLFILLDEILKGTNSRDKQSGSRALLEKLLHYDASGMVATHDLALGDMEKIHPGNILNKSFEVVIENDLLVFDYRLKEGIARQMNATFLMKKMGITD